MTMHEEWTEQLSAYLDGELSNDERDAVDAHLRECPACTAVLNDLKRVVAMAQASEARPPQADLWAGIAGRLEAGAADAGTRVVPFAARQPRRVAFTLAQLAAAAAVLMAVSGGIAWKLADRSPEGLRHTAPAPSATEVAQGFSPASDPDAAPAARAVPVGLADAQYDAAVADLEKALQAGRGHLDTSTIAIVERNLQIIDQAIEQARQALVTDPANSYLSSHLVETRRRKLDLLRRAAALTETN
jgi:anti-sigma factor RsiW